MGELGGGGLEKLNQLRVNIIITQLHCCIFVSNEILDFI